jgi:hypothetical protein
MQQNRIDRTEAPQVDLESDLTLRLPASGSYTATYYDQSGKWFGSWGGRVVAAGHYCDTGRWRRSRRDAGRLSPMRVCCPVEVNMSLFYQDAQVSLLD